MNKHLIILAIAILLICVGLSGCTSEFEKDFENGKPKILIKECEIIIDSADIEKVYIDSINVLLKNEGDSSVSLGYIVLTSGENEIKSPEYSDIIEAGEEKNISESIYGYFDRGYFDRKIGTETLNVMLSILTTFPEKVVAEKNITVPIPFIKVGDTIPEVGSSHNMSMTILSYLEGDIAVTYSISQDKYTTWSPLEGRKFIVVTFEFQNNWIKPQRTPYLHEGEIATDKGYVYPVWAYYSEKGEYRDSTEEEINTYIGDTGAYVELLPEESDVVGCIVFEIPEEEKALEASIGYIPFLIRFEGY